ncbi:hypothetical protein ACFL27_22555, partial [candidate division CSSED10-310 bacterium]
MILQKYIPDIIVIFIFCALGFSLYHIALPCDFFWDDDAHVRISAIKSLSPVQKFFKLDNSSGINHPNRGLTYFSHALVHHFLGGMEPYWFRMVNLILHICNAFLLWKVLVIMQHEVVKSTTAFSFV